MLKDCVGEFTHVKGLQGFERLDELQDVVPLSVEDELPKEEDVVGVVPVDDAGFSLDAELGDVKFSVVEELEGQSHHVLLAE